MKGKSGASLGWEVFGERADLLSQMKWHRIRVVESSMFPWNAAPAVSVSVFASVYSYESCLAGDKLPSFSTYFLPTRSFPVVLMPFLPSRGSLGSPDLPSVHALSWMSYVELDLHILGCSMFFLCFWMRGGVDFVSLTVSCGFSS